MSTNWISLLTVLVLLCENDSRYNTTNSDETTFIIMIDFLKLPQSILRDANKNGNYF